MIRFALLDKAQKAIWLPRLFDLLYTNMQQIAPSGLPREQAWAQWNSQVSPALECAPRQILLCFADDQLAGFAQYYTRKELLMIEELQISPRYQKTGVFGSFCRKLAEFLNEQIMVVEAYADRRNGISHRIMRKLGMEELPEDDPEFVHLRGAADEIRRMLTR